MTTFSSKSFKPEATKEANLEARDRWLDKAVKYEAEKKSANITRLAFNKAHDYERAALNY